MASTTMTIRDTVTWKRELRRKIRELMRNWSGDTSVACESLELWLEDLSVQRKTQTKLKVATFYPIAGEPDLRPLLNRHQNITWGFPRVEGKELVFHEVDSLDDLVAGAYGIQEPQKNSPVIEVTTFDVFLCPGLAFSPTGERLGRGKGFYDRMLTRSRPDAVKIGVGLEFQWSLELPAEPHDVRMDRVCCGRNAVLVHKEVSP